jgi:hypothetical protein
MVSWPCRSIRRRPYFRRNARQTEPDISATRHVSLRRSAGVRKRAANSHLGAPIFRHISANPLIPRHCRLWPRNHRHPIRWIAPNGFGDLSGAQRPGNQPVMAIGASSRKILLAHNYKLNQYPTTREPAALLSCRQKNPSRPSAKHAPIYASTPTIPRVQACAWMVALRLTPRQATNSHFQMRSIVQESYVRPRIPRRWQFTEDDLPRRSLDSDQDNRAIHSCSHCG